jgi:hypothetical protein
MKSIWILEQRYRVRKNGKWSPWVDSYGTMFYPERPADRETDDGYMQRRAVEFRRVETTEAQP